MKKKHEIVKEDILEKILTEIYAVGTIIPTEAELTEEYSVSRPTVRQAIKALVAEGYLERKQRVGTRVIRKKINQEFTQSLSSFNDEMAEKGVIPETQVISFSEVSASKEVSKILQLDNDDLVYKLVRLRSGDKSPIVIVTTYLPVKYLPNLMEYNFETDSLYNVLEALNCGIKSISRTLEITLADGLTSELLNVKEGDPLYYFKSIGKTSSEVPIEYSIARYRGDVNTFKFEVTLK